MSTQTLPAETLPEFITTLCEQLITSGGGGEIPATGKSGGDDEGDLPGGPGTPLAPLQGEGDKSGGASGGESAGDHGG